jgi:hypothetical protein
LALGLRGLVTPSRIVCIGAPQDVAQPYGEWIDGAEPVGF